MFDLIPYRGENFFGQFFGDDFAKMMDTPRGMNTDIKETDDGYIINMNIPGYEKGDIEIGCKAEVLTISAEKKEEKEVEEDDFIRRERFFGKRVRSFSLKGLDQDSIDASYENGVLLISIKKDEKYINDKKVEIK